MVICFLLWPLSPPFPLLLLQLPHTLDLVADGVKLALSEPTDADSVDVVLGLDIQDDFTFTAERLAGG
jgi:hypothetical protein